MYEKETKAKFIEFVTGLTQAETRALYTLYLNNGVRKIIEEKIYGKR